MKISQYPILSLLIGSLMIMGNVMASSPLAPLGFALAITSPSDVRTKLKGKGPIEQIGINRYSKGPMLKVAGIAFDVRGLKDVVFIFDAADQLTAVNLHMNKRQFDKVFSLLKQKYVLQKKRIPFVGNKSARFSHGHASVSLDAPHLGFTMQVTYQTDKFEKAYKDRLAKDKVNRKKKEKSAF